MAREPLPPLKNLLQNNCYFLLPTEAVPATRPSKINTLPATQRCTKGNARPRSKTVRYELAVSA